MSAAASQITSVSIVCATVGSGADQNKTSKLRVTGLCAWNSPVTGEFPAQMASNAENVSIGWRHHVKCSNKSSTNNSNDCSRPRAGHKTLPVLRPVYAMRNSTVVYMTIAAFIRNTFSYWYYNAILNEHGVGATGPLDYTNHWMNSQTGFVHRFDNNIADFAFSWNISTIQTDVLLLTHWGRDKIAAISERAFQLHSLEQNVWISIKILLKFVPKTLF